MLVRWEHRKENMLDYTVVDQEREPLVHGEALSAERRRQ